MAHCTEEEADVAVAEIAEANASTALEVAQTVLDLANLALEECLDEH